MTISWQDIATACIILAALGYLAYRLAGWIRRKGFPACSGCTKCSSDSTEKPLVTLDSKSRKQQQR